MELKKLKFKGQTCVILGAGATRGASFIEDTANPSVYPPLDSDFFTQIQRLTQQQHRDIVEKLIRYTVLEFGNGFSLTMEEFFTQIEVLPEIYSKLAISRGKPTQGPKRAAAWFKKALMGVLAESLANPANHRLHYCSHHMGLVRLLNADDTIISFNYDCLLEQSLKDNRYDYWNPEYSYCVDLPVNGDTEFWQCPVGRGHTRRRKWLSILKMHGSLNWRISGDGILLTAKPYWDKGELAIVPPRWRKDVLDDPLYKPIWKSARRGLEEAKCLVIIGYSLPATDLLAQTLFRCRNRPSEKTTGDSFLKLLVIANPDREVRQRFINVLKGSLNENTRILVFETMGECAKYLSAMR